MQSTPLTIRQNEAAGTIEIFRKGETKPILTQVAKDDFRPYLHPIVAPDGKGLLTEYSEICPDCEGRGVLVDYSMLE